MPAREYTPQRKRIMQIVMGAILLATVALAAVVTHSVNSRPRVELSPTRIERENVSVRLPLHWKPGGGADDDPRVIAQAIEPATQQRGGQRRLRVMIDRIETPASAMQYLHDAFAIDDSATLALTHVGAHDGILAQVQSVGDEGHEERNNLYAVTVLPSLQVIVVHLSTTGEADIFDQALVHHVAGEIEIGEEVRPEPADAVITLPLGIELQPPAGFVAMQKSDTNRTDRLFWLAPTASRRESTKRPQHAWTSIEVVGCLFPQLDAKDPGRSERGAAALQTLMLVRDPTWRGASVREAQGVWRIDREAIGLEFPARAYLMPHASGRALLVVFRGIAGNSDTFDRIWQDMAQKVKFLPAADVAQLEDAGAAEASRLLRSDINKLVRDRDDQWWIYINAGNRPHVGWSSLQWQPPPKIAANLETRLRSFAGNVSRIDGSWNISADGQKYAAERSRADERNEQTRTIHQGAVLERRQLSLTARINDKSPAAASRNAPPAQYIPGGLLPLLIGRLDPGPLLIKTESFLDCEVAGAPDPLTVIIRPGLNSTRKADGETEPMRCVTAEVNGSGRVTRWYFRSTGELECVELPAGVTMMPSSPDDVRNNFGSSGPMTP